MGRAGRRVLAVAGIAVVAALGFSVTADAGGKTLLIANCNKPKFEPVQVILACGDASFSATAVTWSSWTGKSATGTGTGQLNDCHPNCASGKVKTGPLTLRASKPQTCKNGRRLFSKLTYTWTSGAPVGNVPDSGSVPVGCKLANL
jgi:hypothetical protein